MKKNLGLLNEIQIQQPKNNNKKTKQKEKSINVALQEEHLSFLEILFLKNYVSGFLNNL